MPVDREEDWCIAKDAEIECVVRVFPNVIAADYEVCAEGLLQAGMELIAEAGLQCSRNPRSASKQRRKNIVSASRTGEHQIFIERSLKRTRIRDTQDGIGLLNVVRSAYARFRPTRDGQTVVEISADTEVEDPVSCLDLVQNIQSEFLDVGVTKECIERS